MKKSVGTSLALVAFALTVAGGIALLGGPNVFSVLSDINFPSKTPAEEPITKKEEEVREKPAPKPDPQNLKFTPPKILENATQKVDRGNGKYALFLGRGERIEYDEHGIPEWSSWEGRLTETKEEKDWIQNYKSPFDGEETGK